MSARSYGLSPGRYRTVRVRRHGKKLLISLHGNLIVDFDIKNGTAVLYHCGYKTLSTTNGINRFLRHMNDHRYVEVKEIRHVWVQRGDPSPVDGSAVTNIPGRFFYRHQGAAGTGPQMILRDRKRRISKMIGYAGVTVSFSGRQMMYWLKKHNRSFDDVRSITQGFDDESIPF